MKRPPVNRRALLVAAIVLAWLGTLSWLVFTEAYPALLQRASGGYRAVLGRGLMVLDQWSKITFQGQPIGYSHTTVDVDDNDPVRQYLVNNRMVLRLNVMGYRQHIAVSAHAAVDALYNLQSFGFILSLSGYAVTIRGQRAGEHDFDVVVRSGGTAQRLSVRIPDDAVVYSAMTDLALRNLAVGRQMKLRVFNPVTLATDDLVVRALRRETLRQGDGEVLATVLGVTIEGMEILAWLDGEGHLLRQETPFGWTLESCSAAEALALGEATGNDMLTALAVPVRGPAAALAGAGSARLRLTGAPLTGAALTTQRQSVQTLTGTVATITVRADRMPAHGPGRDAMPPEVAPWLAASPFIQAGDARLVAQAHRITGDWTDSVAAARAIYRWVQANVAKIPTVSLPSARDVLDKLEGDCNEHTYLFVGLARAAGLPAKVRVGLTLQDNLFYYHAWPSVYVGEWVDMDPTLGRETVGADHLSLFEGELAEQMRLMGVLGRLQVEVLAVEAPTP